MTTLAGTRAEAVEPTSPGTGGGRSSPATRSDMRPDIQALRALAVLAVLVYHMKPELLTGGLVGVDIFFVLSGFLISSHLFGELARTGRISLRRFWARRARRLLPASLTVLAATAVGVALLVPEPLHERFFRDITGAVFYVANWLFAAQSVDYFAIGGAESPVLHFWSLGVEEQLYVFWPLLLVAGWAWLGRRVPKRAALATAILLVAVPSFVLGAIMVDRGDASAYFVTTVRVWEFAAGALVGLAMLDRGRRRGTGPLREDGALWTIVSYLGWAILIASMVLFRVELGFPGVNAVPPVVGTAMVLWANNPRGSGSLSGVLSARPVQFVGATSYSIYLWHWPVLVLAPYALIAASAAGLAERAGSSGTLTEGQVSLLLGTGGTAVDDLTWVQLIAVVAVVVLAAWVTTRVVEDPFRFSVVAVRSRPAAVFAAAAAAMAVVAGGVQLAGAGTAAALSAQRAEDRAIEQDLVGRVASPTQRPPAWDERTCMGPNALTEPDCAAFTWSGIVPALGVEEETAGDIAPLWSDGQYSSCLSFNSDYTVHHCVFGVRGGPKVALVGDSHAFHWLPAFNALAEQEGLELHFFARSGCPLNLTPPKGPADHVAGCLDWSRAVVPIVVENGIDTVVISNWAALRFDQGSFDSSADAGVDGYKKAWAPILDAGAEVVVLRDTPSIGAAAWNCAQANPNDVNRCAPSPANALDETDPRLAAAAALRLEVLDFTRFFCTDDSCPIAIGGVRVYRDANHMTGTYNLLLTPHLEEALLR